MKANTLWLLPVLLLAAQAGAQDKEQTVEVVGEAAIVNNDEVKAREDARRAALRNAVEQVAGTLVSADTLVQNSQLVQDRILTNAQGYVKKFSTPKYTKEGGVVTASLTATVSTAALDKDLQAIQLLVKSMDGRKLVILLQEQSIDTGGVVTSSGVMSQALTDAFKKDGWTIIDPSFAAEKVRLAPGAAMGAVEAKEIGNLSKADVILYGRVTFRFQPDGAMTKGFFPVTGEWDVSAFATDSGSQLANLAGKFNSGKKTGIISYERTAFDLARDQSNDTVGQVRQALYTHLSSARQNGNRVVVDVVGLVDYAAVEDFKRVLGQRRGVNDVAEGSFSGGKANYEVLYVGSTQDLAGEFRTATFKGKKVSVTGRSQNRVELTVGR
jgi:hypothetical protein